MASEPNPEGHGFAFVERWFFSGFSGDSLGALRPCIAFGLVFFHISQFYSLLTLDAFGPGFYYLEPMWYFDWLGITHDVPWLNIALFALLIAATVTMGFGWRTRISIVVILLCVFYLKGVRDSYTGDVHHRYLMPVHVLFLLLVSKCGHRFSLDARRVGSRRVSEWEASWPIKSMQLYIASFYLWSVAAKLRVSGWAWFEGGGRLQEILLSRSVMWGIAEDGNVVSNQFGFWVAHQHDLLTVLAILTLVMEFGFPVLILVKSPWLRLLALLSVTAFHVVNFLVLYVGFLFLPLVFFVFFDMAVVWRRLQHRFAGGRRLLRRAT